MLCAPMCAEKMPGRGSSPYRLLRQHEGIPKRRALLPEGPISKTDIAGVLEPCRGGSMQTGLRRGWDFFDFIVGSYRRIRR